MQHSRTPFLVLALMAISAIGAFSQQYSGEVSGWMSGVTHKYNGDFTSDLWGAGGMLSLQYAPIRRLGIEARVGLGEYRWGTSRSDMAAHPGYYGPRAKYGDNYPRTLTAIERENESRITTMDVLVNYVLVENIPAIPFISAGVGLINFAPSTSEAHDPLPNAMAGLYNPSAVSIPLGGGVRIPISYRVGIMLRGEYRFVFSKFLDDVSYNGANDGLTSVSLGFTYRFTNPPRPRRHHGKRHMCSGPNCLCEGAPMHGDEDCPCSIGNERGRVEDEAATGGGAAPNHMSNNGGQSGADSAGTNGKQSATTKSDAAATPQDSLSTKPAPEPPSQKKADSSTASADQVPPCPDGTVRVCVDKDKSVCVSRVESLGSDRIRWEDALIYDPTDPNHSNTLRQANQDSPFYANVIRQTANAYYLCVDCSFTKQRVGDSAVYVMIDGTVTKGQGTFDPQTCPECDKLAAEGR